MLQAQVNYWTLQENKRHNLEAERLGFDTLNETKRHNVMGEDISKASLEESKRHNIASEQLGWFNATESQRHNVVQESLTGFQNQTNRINAQTNYHDMQIREQAQNWKETVDTMNLGFKTSDLNLGQANVDIAARNATSNEIQAESSRRRSISDQLGTAGKVVSDIMKLGFAVLIK